MIPESAGITPYGIFVLADAYLDTAALTFAHRPHSPQPIRMLAYHAAELFLKAFLRAHRWQVTELRSLQHDLPRMLQAAETLGLGLPWKHVALVKKIEDRNDYVRVRYVVVEQQSDVPVAAVIDLVSDIRQAICQSLNLDQNGAPKGDMWVAGEPDDYVARRSIPIDVEAGDPVL